VIKKLIRKKEKKNVNTKILYVGLTINQETFFLIASLRRLNCFFINEKKYFIETTIYKNIPIIADMIMLPVPGSI
tara:strand:+ start:47 stop:271 length:225 start_codon:yes stop_codon:yes gene_type:complete